MILPVKNQPIRQLENGVSLSSMGIVEKIWNMFCDQGANVHIWLNSRMFWFFRLTLLACPNNSKRRNEDWETFQISGGKNNCTMYLLSDVIIYRKKLYLHFLCTQNILIHKKIRPWISNKLMMRLVQEEYILYILILWSIWLKVDACCYSPLLLLTKW